MVILRSDTKREMGMDRISELPESLIHYIFSFLPIKSVVSTSILSTKWRYIWTSISIIDLREWRSVNASLGNCRDEVSRFMRFVDRVLSNRQDVRSPSIKKFVLSFDTYFDTSRVNGWISTVLRHKVEELALVDRKGIMFPPSLFTCESLTVLEIDKGFLELPESVNFPNLKILGLSIMLTNDHLIQKLLSNSPVLEELSLEMRNWNIQHLSIFSPKLKRLFMNGLLYRKFDIQISAPSLQSFKYSEVLAKDFVLQNFLTLLDAEVVLSCVADRGERDELGCLAAKIFASLSNVKRLKISEYTLKLLSYQDDFQTKLPLYYNLNHLEVSRASFHFRRDGYFEDNVQCWIVKVLFDFLQVSPNLESLIFDEGFSNCKSNNYDGWLMDLIPQCLLLHLKSIEFRGFFGKQIEKDLVRLFLKNAKVLQRARITISGKSSLSKNSNFKKEVVDEIALFPRGSAECILHIS
ncbi:FBD-associated F-box protein At4g10400-like [Papaver somniferum]|uniref:FBD-associated F-box protein At4g10400-like n=1 Tax=Papaver somniferum TaxID=3469 RepID=UPI000E70099A|nr:FBD-associated F-box protein At4g10400-like [Papaver somniferum]XP_026421262.1 FBD-associated F-box protein At4g10400-like [Papaver somniferum]